MMQQARWIWMISAIGISILTIALAQNLGIGLLLAEFRLNDVDNDNIPGRGGVDYPVYSSPPEGTSFRCKDYDYAGYFGDVEAGCQAYHVCFPDGRNASFLCVNGTVFHQRYFVCDWWFHFNCSHAPSMYDLNLFRKIPLPVLPPVRRRPFVQPVPEPKVIAGPGIPNPKKAIDKDKKPKQPTDKKKNVTNKQTDTGRTPRKNSNLSSKKPDDCICTCENGKKPSDKYLSIDLN